MKFLRYVLAIAVTSLTALLTTAACAAPVRNISTPPLQVQTQRAVVIKGVIARGNLEAIGTQLLDWSKADPKRPVDVVIASPGGDVVTGFMFVNQLEAVRARGTVVRCFVPTLAASMAFQILLHCDQRYTLDHAWLLWHGVRVFANGNEAITAASAAELSRELGRLDRVILRELRATLGLPMDVIQRHFDRETLHLGQDLAEMAPSFLTSLPSVPGLFEALATAPHSEEPLLFGESDVFAPGQIVYLAPGWIQ